jgi:hypothetical protein
MKRVFRTQVINTITGKVAWILVFNLKTKEFIEVGTKDNSTHQLKIFKHKIINTTPRGIVYDGGFDYDFYGKWVDEWKKFLIQLKDCKCASRKLKQGLYSSVYYCSVCGKMEKV